MIEACDGENETAMWLVCDQATLRKYGLGYAKPAPMPLGGLIRNGYLIKGDTLAELAQHAGIDAAGARSDRARVQRRRGQRRGPAVRPRHARPSTATSPTPRTSPTPASRRSAAGRYYAVKVVMGDLGTFDGLTHHASSARC